MEKWITEMASAIVEFATNQKVVSLATVLAALAAIITLLHQVYSKRAERRKLDRLRRTPTNLISISVSENAEFLNQPIRDQSSEQIRFGVAPYIDHTYAFIAERLG